MPRLLSHMLDPDCPLLLRQVCCQDVCAPLLHQHNTSTHTTIQRVIGTVPMPNNR